MQKLIEAESPERPIYSIIKHGVLVKFDERDLNINGGYTPPRNVKVIGYGAFRNCNRLIKIKLHKGIVEIKPNAFWNCQNLESVDMTDNVKRMGICAFMYCENLKKIKLSSNIDCIEGHTFIGCTSLEQIKLPENLKRIEWSAFCECEKLKNVNMPQNLEYVDENSFYLTPVGDSFIRKFEENKKSAEQSKGVNE